MTQGCLLQVLTCPAHEKVNNDIRESETGNTKNELRNPNPDLDFGIIFVEPSTKSNNQLKEGIKVNKAEAPLKKAK